MSWILDDLEEDFQKYLGGSEEEYNIKLGEAVVRNNLGFSNIPALHVRHHEYDHQVTSAIQDQLMDIF